ncbi:MAG TPA: molybdopterin-dependent oxidoreductase [Armatimonadota bacterium]|nr:molybdopterin-dependent oxidoreductase [Armatimonadota bacterium]
MTDRAPDRGEPAEESQPVSDRLGTPAAEPAGASQGPADRSDSVDGPRTSPSQPSRLTHDRAPLDEAEVRIRQMSRRSFIWAAVAVAGAFAGRKWLITRRQEDGVPWPFRRAMDINQELTDDYYSRTRLAPTFDVSLAREPQLNGDYGMQGDFDASTWQLRVQGLYDMSSASTDYVIPAQTSDDSSDSGSTDSSSSDSSSDSTSDSSGADRKTDSSSDSAASGSDSSNDSSDNSDNSQSNPPAVLLTMKEIKALPKYEIVTLFKCVEGWSYVVHWGGARLSDFMEKYGPITQSGDAPDVMKKPDDLAEWVGMETPDGGYYVAIDMESALHPQTLLCYEMNGKPLPEEHGGPLRLVIPLKYNIKNLKRIGLINFTLDRPHDYWGENGYDYYSGH